VERHDERSAEHQLDVRRHHAGHEEVRVHQVVAAVPPAEAQHVVGERIHVREDRLLGNALRRARDDVDHADAVVRDNLRQPWVVAAREHIDTVAAVDQMPAKLIDVDVLAAAVGPAQKRQGRGMLADHSDAFHAMSPPTAAPDGGVCAVQ
jgi:hypothetical protein